MEYLSQKDEELAKLVMAKDQQALAELINRYQNKLFYYVTRLVGNGDDAADIVQDTFIKVYEHIHSFDAERKFSSWIYRISHNIAINYIKKNKKTTAMEIHSLDWLMEHREQVEDFLANEERIELSQDMISSLEFLRSEYKEVLLLYYFEEKSYEEISDILHIPEATVGVWLKRAKSKLKELLNKKNGK